MRRPWYQRWVVGSGLILGGFVGFGAVLDSLGAAIPLIPPRVAYFGTAAIIAILLVVASLARWRGLRWSFRGKIVVVRRLRPNVLLPAVGCIALLWAPRFYTGTRQATPSPGLPQFPLYQSGLRDLKGAYFGGAPIRMIDGLVLDDSQSGKYDNYNTLRERSIHVENGSSILVSVFFYNSALDPAASDTTLIYNARVTAGVGTDVRTTHSVSAGYVGDNTRAVYSHMPGRGGNLIVKSDRPTRLTYVPGSTFACVLRPPFFERRPPVPTDPTGVCANAYHNGPVQLLPLPDGISDGAVPIGHIPGQTSGFVVFRLTAVAEDWPQR